MSTEKAAALITGSRWPCSRGFRCCPSKIAMRDAIAAKEAGQRREQLRVKATEAGERLLDAVAVDDVFQFRTAALRGRRGETVRIRRTTAHASRPIPGAGAGGRRRASRFIARSSPSR
jgi:hypothetical protein